MINAGHDVFQKLMLRMRKDWSHAIKLYLIYTSMQYDSLTNEIQTKNDNKADKSQLYLCVRVEKITNHELHSPEINCIE